MQSALEFQSIRFTRHMVHTLPNLDLAVNDTLEPSAALRAISEDASLIEMKDGVGAYDEVGKLLFVSKHDMGQLVPTTEPWSPPGSSAIVAAGDAILEQDLGQFELDLVGLQMTSEMKDVLTGLLHQAAFADVPGRSRFIRFDPEQLSGRAGNCLDTLVSHGVLAVERSEDQSVRALVI